MYPIEDIITVDVNLSKECYKPEYQVLVDMPLEYVIETARNNEPNNIFTFPFYTGSVEDVPDFSTVSVVEYGHQGMTDEEVERHNESCLSVVEGLHHLMRPCYVGNVEEPYKAIEKICKMFLEG